MTEQILAQGHSFQILGRRSDKHRYQGAKDAFERAASANARNFRFRIQRIFIRFAHTDYSNLPRLRQFAACGEYFWQLGRNNSGLTLNMVPSLQRAAG